MANTEKNPKEECKAVITRSQRRENAEKEKRANKKRKRRKEKEKENKNKKLSS